MALHEKVIAYLASRRSRLHHFLWHQIRDTWEWSSTTDEQRSDIEKCGWAPNGRASQDRNRRWRHDNGAGEDFLFMHRQMIAVVRKITEDNDGDMDSVTGWGGVPSPANTTYPVSQAWDVYGAAGFNRFMRAVKADDYYYLLMREWERKFTDRVYLRGLHLGELGSRIESTIHNMMHMRWCDRPWDPRTGKQEASIGRPDTEIDAKWDDARYDWLGDTYSSHVNATFWKLHGWVDERMNDWYAANQDTGQVHEINLRGVRWFTGPLVKVTDPWSGGMDFGTGEHGIHHVKEMENVAKIILGLASHYHFYDD